MAQKPDKPARKPAPPWVKKTLRIVLKFRIPLLCLIALMTGLFVGYVYMGGRNASDVLDFGTWKHLFDLIFAN